MIKNFKCTVAYDGTSYFGWQRQKNFLTVQGIIEFCLEKIFNEKIKIYGASRTDAKVHAKGQIFNFKVDTPIDENGLKKILNSLLPEDIRIKDVEIVEEKFSARCNIKKKLYRYLIYNSSFLPPFLKNYVWHIPDKLYIERFLEIKDLFIGEKNFYSFTTSDPDINNFYREIINIRIKKNGKFFIFDFVGKSFLYNMIRRIVGCFIAYHQKKITKEKIIELFEKPDRSALNIIAPPQGLYLIKIIYNKK